MDFMTERTKRIIVGGISGGATGIIMEVLSGSSYMSGVSAPIKAVLAGILACVIYMLIIRMINKTSSAGAGKA